MSADTAAIAALRAAVATSPLSSAAHKNLAVLLWQAGRIGEARDVLAHAVQMLPADASLWSRLARVQGDLGEAVAGLASLEQAQRLGPRDAATWTLIGSLHAEAGRWPQSANALEQAAVLDPGMPDIELRLARARQELGEMGPALEALARGAARDPANLAIAVEARLMLPQVYSSRDDLRDWRARYQAGLEELVTDASAYDARQVIELNHYNFLLAYQGEDDLALQRAYSGFIGGLAARARPEWMQARARDFDGGRRLRVGFAGSIFRDCTAGRYFERWITGLDGTRFERFVYHGAPVVDAVTRRIASACEHFVPCRTGNADTIDRIAADRLDVLVQPEVGMSPLSYLLAAVRVAPVQVAGWGHPVTTGSENVDCYFSSDPMEPAGSQIHYRESLVLLPGLGVDYAMPTPVSPLPRSALGLPEGKRLYVCPQSLFKIHPDMDDLLARIVAEDGDALLLFFQSPAREVTVQFGDRMQRALEGHGVPPGGQVKFLPRMDSTSFRRMLAACDVVVDTVHWSGGNTSLDALAAGTPVVTWPGRFMRGRQSAAMLGLMGLGELVATDADGFVRLALDVARDRSRNRALREAIAARRGALFGRSEPLAAFQEALLSIGAKGRP